VKVVFECQEAEISLPQP